MTDEPLSKNALDVPVAGTPGAPDAGAQVPGGDRRGHRTRTRFGAAFLIALFVGLTLGGGALYAFDINSTGRVLPGVTVGGVGLAGLTPSEAATRLREAYAHFGKGKAIVAGGGHEMAIDYADIGRRPDVDRMVAEAMAVGRDGNPVERVILHARTAVRGVDLAPLVTFDSAKLARYVQTYASRLRVDPRDAVVAAAADGFTVTNGVNGRVADRVAPTDELTQALADVDAPSQLRVDLEVTAVEPEVTTADAATAKATADRIATDIAIVHGKETWMIPAKTVRSWISFATGDDGAYAPVIDPARVTAELTTLAKKIATKASNASFKVSGSKITGVIAGKNGRALDVPATAGRVTALLGTRASGGADAPVQPALSVTAPNLTTDEARAAAPKMKKISTWTTYFFITERNHFGANIWIPAMDIDGTVVGPGETFDFWKAVGPVTRGRGYGDGGAIINGKTEPQGALAGGICSCSTTLFNAALRAGYDMKARRNHYYYIDRYPIGLDATVFKSGSGSTQTMSFVNDTPHPLLIRGYKIRSGGKGFVRFDLYSVPTGRKVVIGAPTIKNVRPAFDTVQYTSSLPAGQRERIESPVDGKDVWRTVTVYENGKVLHRTTYYSHYSRITGVVLVGKGS
jgi:vancomycin resistance protein YoaR